MNVLTKLNVNIKVKTLKIKIEKIPPQGLVTWDSESARKMGNEGNKSNFDIIFFIFPDLMKYFIRFS